MASTADLNPLFRPTADLVIAESTAAIRPGGHIAPASTFRLLAEQEALQASKLSKVKLGWHNFGLALDVAVIDADGKYIRDGADSRYAVFGRIAKSHGCIWGGDWGDPDFDHIEFHPDFTLEEYRDWLAAHQLR